MTMDPTNILVQVQTYNKESLAYLENLNCFIGTLNKKFKALREGKPEGNLGDTLTFDLPPRSVANQGLIASFQPAVQRLQKLAITQSQNASMAFTAQQFAFNVKDYMEEFGKSRVEELSTQIEANIALNAISGVPVMAPNAQGQYVPTGALYTDSGPYRFYGDGINPINSFGQLAKMLAFYRNYGAPAGAPNVFLSDLAIPDIINTGANQFVPARNEKYTNSWDLGTYKGSNANFFQSNLLPIQNAGTCGNSQQVLTVISTNDPTGANITQITVSGATPSDVNAIKSGDLAQFNDGVGSLPNLRYLTFTGHIPSGNPVQIRMLANATADGSGHVVLSIFPPLQSTFGNTQNLNTPIQAGMQLSVLPSHRAGVIVGGNAAFLGMPQLPDETPYPTGNAVNKATGATLRTYYGSIFGQNTRGIINDCVWNATFVPEYCMRIIFPL